MQICIWLVSIASKFALFWAQPAPIGCVPSVSYWSTGPNLFPFHCGVKEGQTGLSEADFDNVGRRNFLKNLHGCSKKWSNYSWLETHRMHQISWRDFSITCHLVLRVCFSTITYGLKSIRQSWKKKIKLKTGNLQHLKLTHHYTKKRGFKLIILKETLEINKKMQLRKVDMKWISDKERKPLVIYHLNY